jgi:hypothetical protein
MAVQRDVVRRCGERMSEDPGLSSVEQLPEPEKSAVREMHM